MTELKPCPFCGGQSHINPCEDCRRNCEVPCWKVEHGLLQPVEWISVEDRLPDEETDVLCWYEYFRYGNYNRMFQTYGTGYYFRDGMWGGEVSTGHKTRVIAWMPLPDPPKEDKND